MNQDYKSKLPLFHDLKFFKKVNEAMKMLNEALLRILAHQFNWNKYTSNGI